MTPDTLQSTLALMAFPAWWNYRDEVHHHSPSAHVEVTIPDLGINGFARLKVSP